MEYTKLRDIESTEFVGARPCVYRRSLSEGIDWVLPEHRLRDAEGSYSAFARSARLGLRMYCW